MTAFTLAQNCFVYDLTLPHMTIKSSKIALRSNSRGCFWCPMCLLQLIYNAVMPFKNFTVLNLLCPNYFGIYSPSLKATSCFCKNRSNLRCLTGFSIDPYMSPHRAANFMGNLLIQKKYKKKKKRNSENSSRKLKLPK